MEHMTFPFEIERKSSDDDEDDDMFRVTGYASTFNNKDLTSDIIKPGAFSNTIKGKHGKNIKVLWQHRVDEPIGKITKAVEDEKGLFIKAEMPKEHSKVRDVAALIKSGVIDAMSIGFAVEDSDVSRSGIRTIKEINLFEVSFVTFPANPKATISDIKGATSFKDLPLADIGRVWTSGAAIKRVREFTNSQDSPSARFRNAFFWFDSENADSFGAYKLPFADVIDGKLTAVPRGIFGAAAALRGARGGVDIPDADRPKVIRHVQRYYDKMGRTSPFENDKAWDLDHVKTMTKEDIFYFLKNANVFEPERLKYFMDRFVSETEKQSKEIPFNSNITKEMLSIQALFSE